MKQNNQYELGAGWFFDIKERVLFRKSYPIWSWIITSFGFSRTDVCDLYCLIQGRFSEEDLMVEPIPLEHDNFLKPEKYPYYFRLINQWTIDCRSIKFLRSGPIFSENGTKVLVREKINWANLIERLVNFMASLSSVLAITALLKEFLRFTLTLLY